MATTKQLNAVVVQPAASASSFAASPVQLAALSAAFLDWLAAQLGSLGLAGAQLK